MASEGVFGTQGVGAADRFCDVLRKHYARAQTLVQQRRFLVQQVVDAKGYLQVIRELVVRAQVVQDVVVDDVVERLARLLCRQRVGVLVTGGVGLRQLRAELGVVPREAQVVLPLEDVGVGRGRTCLLYTSPSPRDGLLSRMPSSA